MLARRPWFHLVVSLNVHIRRILQGRAYLDDNGLRVVAGSSIAAAACRRTFLRLVRLRTRRRAASSSPSFSRVFARRYEKSLMPYSSAKSSTLSSSSACGGKQPDV